MADRRRKYKLYKNAKYGVEIQIYVDNTDLFSAEFNGKTYANRVAADLVAELEGLAKEGSQLTWIPVIRVEYPSTSAFAGVSISIKFDRFWTARRFDGSMVKSTWATPVEKRQGQGVTLPAEVQQIPHYHSSTSWSSYDVSWCLLPYSPELWRSLQCLELSLAAFRNEIIALFTTDVGINNLFQAGQQSLSRDPIAEGGDDEDMNGVSVPPFAIRIGIPKES